MITGTFRATYVVQLGRLRRSRRTSRRADGHSSCAPGGHARPRSRRRSRETDSFSAAEPKDPCGISASPWLRGGWSGRLVVGVFDAIGQARILRSPGSCTGRHGVAGTGTDSEVFHEVRATTVPTSRRWFQKGPCDQGATASDRGWAFCRQTSSSQAATSAVWAGISWVRRSASRWASA